MNEKGIKYLCQLRIVGYYFVCSSRDISVVWLLERECKNGRYAFQKSLGFLDYADLFLRKPFIVSPISYLIRLFVRSKNPQVDERPIEKEDQDLSLCLTDIDECVRGVHRCGSQQTCVNTDGSYSCVCGKGYQASGSSCFG